MEKSYHLFGTEAVSEYEEKGIKRIKKLGIEFSTFVFTIGVTTVFEILNAYDGWGNFCKITEEEYNKLNKV